MCHSHCLTWTKHVGSEDSERLVLISLGQGTSLGDYGAQAQEDLHLGLQVGHSLCLQMCTHRNVQDRPQAG